MLRRKAGTDINTSVERSGIAIWQVRCAAVFQRKKSIKARDEREKNSERDPENNEKTTSENGVSKKNGEIHGGGQEKKGGRGHLD